MNRSSLLAVVLGGLVVGGCKPDCADVEAEARALVVGVSTCQADADCKILDFSTVVPGSCVGAFQCAAAVRADLQLVSFTRQARDISSDKQDCGECIMAGCLAPETLRAVCNMQSQRCEIATPPQ